MLEFASPQFLWLLLGLAPLGWWTLWRPQRRAASIRFSDVSLFDAVRPSPILRMRRMLPALELAALALLIVALARPRFGTVERDVTQEGVDLFYCLDISGSMRAEDFEPNRLEKAKELTAAFARKRETDRQGLVVFSGAAFVLCPLTFDSGTVCEFIENVTFDDVGVQGTAIGMGLCRALKKMEESKAKSRVIVLMTDGENNAGQITPQQAIEVAKTMGVRVYTIGIGSDGEAWAMQPTQFGMQRVRIRTTIDEELLGKIADETGGVYRRAHSAKELETVLEKIDQLERTEIEMKEYRTYDERMALACWPALALLALYMLLAGTRFLKIP